MDALYQLSYRGVTGLILAHQAMFNQPSYFLRVDFLAGVPASFGSFGVTNASIIPHAMLLTRKVTNNIPDADAARCADEALNNVNNPATASPIIASII